MKSANNTHNYPKNHPSNHAQVIRKKKQLETRHPVIGPIKTLISMSTSQFCGKNKSIRCAFDGIHIFNAPFDARVTFSRAALVKK